MDIKEFFTITCVLFTSVWQSSDSVPVCCRISNLQGKSHVICSGCGLLAVPKNLPTNTTVLDLSNNKFTSLERGSFPDLPLLKILYLQRNKLVRITSGSFDNVSNIQEFYLTDNKLEQFSMDMNVFEILKKLKTLKIQRNNFHIKKLYPEQALSTISKLEYLSMDIFDGFQFGKRIINQTNLRKLHLSSRGTGGVSLLNSSFDGLATSNVKELIIIAPFRKLQTNFLSPFGDLTTLTLRSTGTGVTLHDALGGLYGIRGRTMESLIIDGFRYKFTKGVDLRESDMYNLGTICARKIHLIANAISTIGTDAVTAWTTKTCIEELDMSENLFYLPQSLPLLVLFRSLVHLYATNCYPKTFGKRSILIPERIGFLPQNLTSIDISYSGFSGSIPNFTIETNGLKVLNVGYSVRHPRCDYVVIKGLVHLQELDMSGVDCSEVYPNAFSEIPNLSRLTARKCRLGSILGSNVPAIFKGLNNLSFVDISANKLQILNSQLFVDQKESLKYLNLSGNLLDHLPTQLL
ncbi:toll-like receptor 3 [Argopecten irradians]|uniref:toll-like receptor 3 n=1 Tax=Argopecten irradians TaxID=31199 RepID=UPI00371F4C9D